MAEQLAVLVDTLKAFGNDLLAIVPRLVAALVLVIAGWVAARLLRRLTIRTLRLARLDVAAEKAGIEDFLVQGGVRMTAVSIVGHLVYWAVNTVVLLAALSALGVDTAGQLFNRMVLFIPNVIAAVVVLIFGALLAQFIGTLVFTYLSNVGVSGASAIAAIARWAVIVFVLAVSLEQLKIGGQILVSAFQIAFGAFCLALALAFGIGGREWAARVLDSFFKK
jgi:Mechanosensitive ion channel, conserved TM helix